MAAEGFILDASPLILLSKIGAFDLLGRLAPRVVVPAAVLAEGGIPATGTLGIQRPDQPSVAHHLPMESKRGDGGSDHGLPSRLKR